MKNAAAFILMCLSTVILSCEAQARSLPAGGRQGIDLADWKLVWQDEFDYANEELDRNWESQNGPSGHILCSRWRENAVVADGILQLVNRKEQRDGQEWIEYTWPDEKRIGCIQFVNGWRNKGTWTGLISDHTLQYHDGYKWIDMSSRR
jgi:hypothetical protein